MQAGKLRHRVAIQKPTASQDSFGQTDDSTASWATIATVWADVRPKTTVETDQEGTTRAVQSYSVEIRYTSDIANDYRLVYDSVNLNIESISKTRGIDRRMLLTCFEQLAD